MKVRGWSLSLGHNSFTRGNKKVEMGECLNKRGTFDTKPNVASALEGATKIYTSVFQYSHAYVQPAECKYNPLLGKSCLFIAAILLP